MARAWYNLGLLVSQAEWLEEAAEFLRAAETADAANADYPYALATVLWRKGEAGVAREAAARALRIDPSHREAAQVLRAR